MESDFAAAMSLYHGFDLLLQHGMRPFYNFMLKTAGEMPKSPGSPSASTGFSPGLFLPKFKSCFPLSNSEVNCLCSYLRTFKYVFLIFHTQVHNYLKLNFGLYLRKVPGTYIL